MWEVEKSQSLAKLRNTLVALEAERGEWEPVGFEKKFGYKGIPHLELGNGENLIHLHGVIDRVDKKSSGEIRVIDYKTGNSHLTKKDLMNGVRLQLPIYGLAAQHALQRGRLWRDFTG